MLVNCEHGKFWAQHLILNCKSSGNGAVKDLDKVQGFVDDLVNSIEMQKHGDLKIEKFGNGKLFGFSFCQFIETSSITGHLCDESGDAYIDIVSCKAYQTRLVIECVQKWFDFECIQQINLERGV